MRYLLAALAITLGTPVASAAARVSALDLSVGGVLSGATEAGVLRRLGSPTRRMETGEGIELYYSGLVVTVAWLEPEAPGRHRRVMALYGTGPRACTPRGLCPGMPVSAVARLYGRTERARRETGTFFEYQPAGLSCWLRVEPLGGVVQSVAVACQP